ncbi:MAG: glycoside hydrolase, partial [Rikenellaceae bacterium]|nr:glycoside hydrolase [Rikenellaceae bacterium]
GLTLSQNECLNSSNGKDETVNETINTAGKTVYLKVVVKEKGVCSFNYSTDGRKFTPFGNEFTAKEGRWIGAKVGLFANRTATGSGGWADVDYFRIEK